MRRTACLCLLCALAAACAGTPGCPPLPAAETAGVLVEPRPAQACSASPFPAWTAEVSARRGDEVEITVRMRRFIGGGDGEARQVFAGRARALAEEAGYAGYEVLRYEEGLESPGPFARRIARGEIRLVRSRIFPGL